MLLTVASVQTPFLDDVNKVGPTFVEEAKELLLRFVLLAPCGVSPREAVDRLHLLLV